MIYKPVLSVKQPWASLIVMGLKPCENRSWPTEVRGMVWIHASMTFDEQGWAWLREDGPLSQIVLDQMLARDCMKRGGIVGRAEIIDCVRKMDSPWFSGPFGFRFGKAETCKFVRCAGTLKFFEVDA